MRPVHTTFARVVIIKLAAMAKVDSNGHYCNSGMDYGFEELQCQKGKKTVTEKCNID